MNSIGGILSQRKISEKEIETGILKYLNKYVPDFFAFKVNTMGVWDTKKNLYRKNRNKFIVKGTADIIGCWRGKFIAIEVKAGYNKPTQDQLDFLERVRYNGGLCLVAYSVDDVIQFLEENDTR